MAMAQIIQYIDAQTLPVLYLVAQGRQGFGAGVTWHSGSAGAKSVGRNEAVMRHLSPNGVVVCGADGHMLCPPRAGWVHVGFGVPVPAPQILLDNARTRSYNANSSTGPLSPREHRCHAACAIYLSNL